tara:strand:- start:1124 stop:1696 length:573 start_codon:yes stop_codon:yes gene_type:complete
MFLACVKLAKVSFTANNWILSSCTDAFLMFSECFNSSESAGAVTMTGWTLGSSSAACLSNAMFMNNSVFNGNLSNWTLYGNNGQRMFQNCGDFTGIGLDTHNWYITSGTSGSLTPFQSCFHLSSNVVDAKLSGLLANCKTIADSNSSYNDFVGFGIGKYRAALTGALLNNVQSLESTPYNWTFLNGSYPI